MKMLSKITLTSTFMFLLVHTTYAACGITSGSINILANDFPALRTYTDTAKACAGAGADFRVNHTSEHSNLAMAALSANPAEYSARIGANSSVVPLMNEGLIRPMDDLVAKYGEDLQKSQLITIGGKVMAVAFMANTQHLYYREDILNELGIAVPKTYEAATTSS